MSRTLTFTTIEELEEFLEYYGYYESATVPGYYIGPVSSCTASTTPQGQRVLTWDGK